MHRPKQMYYDTLEVEIFVWQHEKFCFFTHIIEKQGKYFLMLEDTDTAQKLRNRLKSLGIIYDAISTDN